MGRADSHPSETGSRHPEVTVGCHGCPEEGLQAQGQVRREFPRGGEVEELGELWELSVGSHGTGVPQRPRAP